MIRPPVNLPATRAESWQYLARFGVKPNSDLPLLDIDDRLNRSLSEVSTRLICLHCTVSLAFDLLRRPIIVTWAEKNKITASFSPREKAFLNGDDTDQIFFQWKVDAIYALTWATKLLDVFDVDLACPNDLILRLPQISKGDAADDFPQSPKLRSTREVIPKLDRLYCLHSAFTDRLLQNEKLEFPEHFQSVVERRSAIEWLVAADSSWDEVILDT